jgi:hypothetical protein
LLLCVPGSSEKGKLVSHIHFAMAVESTISGYQGVTGMPAVHKHLLPLTCNFHQSETYKIIDAGNQGLFL